MTRPAPVILDPQAHVSRHIARRTRDLIGQVRVWSVDGQDIRERRDLLAVSASTWLVTSGFDKL